MWSGIDCVWCYLFGGVGDACLATSLLSHSFIITLKHFIKNRVNNIFKNGFNFLFVVKLDL